MKPAAEKKTKNKSLEDLKKQNEEYLDRLKRLQAEFENFQKRVEKEKGDFKSYSTSDLMRKLLDVVDNFERAINAFKESKGNDEHVKGLEMIYQNLYGVLEAEGLKPVHALHEKFDPYRHEVISKTKSEKPEGTVIEEIQKGYMLKDKVLRHTKVIISAGN